MEISVARETFVFFSCALAGGLLFFVYDLFRLIRRQEPNRSVMIHVQDGLFWALGLFILFFALFYINNGIIRFYEFLGIILGVVLYECILSPWVLRVSDWILRFFSKVFKKFFKILLTPLIFMYNIMYRCLCFVLFPLKKLGKRSVDRMLTATKRASKLLHKK